MIKIPCGLYGRFVLFMLGVEVGKGLRISSAPLVFRHKNARIIIGNNVAISNRLMENPAGAIHRTVLAATKDKARLIIGDRVGISGAIIFATKEIIIGDYTQIGAGVKIYDTDFHPAEKISRRNNDQSKTAVAPVYIGKDVWIGANALIMKGITIGEGSIIAAGSIVVKNVDPNTLVGGNPDKFLKKL
jgi:acetyltransferase-like isoleucine patch superfamily enzyme